MRYIDVILPLPLQDSFTYILQDEFAERVKVGMRVAVPFGKTKVYTAVVYKIHDNKPLHYEAKMIEDVIDEKPIVTHSQLQFFEWIASYYLCRLGEVLRAALPSAFLIESETVITRHPDANLEQDLTDEEVFLMDALEMQSALKTSDVMSILGKKTIFPSLNKMVEKNLIMINQELNKQYKPKILKYLRIHHQYKSQEAVEKTLEDLSNATKQKEVYLKMFSLEATQKRINRKSLKKAAEVSDGVIKALIDKDILEEYELRQDRVGFDESIFEDKEIKLSSRQQQAFQEIEENFENKNITLFQGVTSSGKTEIYIHLIEQYIKEGKQVLYLLPEIALTTQLITRLQAYFGDQVIVFHSKFSVNERVEAYMHVLNGTKGKIIIGARSSIFLPFQNLGFVIVDESHEISFKQYDPAPRYQARDSAIVLSHLHQGKTLLGTATPSLESLYNVKIGKYAYTNLTKRYGDVLAPVINIVDLQDRYKKKKMKGHFSEDLLLKMEETLKNGEQVILFQNRRGYSPILECNDCGHSPQCPNCDVSLTYHKNNNTLRCHYCGYHIAMQIKCMACGSKDITTKGFGTEQIETEAKALFPDAVVKRMDQDTTRGKTAYADLISDFENKEIDVLVGTQMLSKGLDFRHVNLVGVMNADSLLNFPDFRAHERCFHLLTQVAGRAGRTKKQGLVLIQSYNPHHQILQQVTTYDYKKMFQEQLHDRKHFKYPPYYRLVKFTLKSRDFNMVNEASDWLAKFYRQIFKSQVLGPEFPPVLRIRNNYHKNIMIKIPPEHSLEKTKYYIKKGQDKFEAISQFRSVRLNIDVDPY
ncbi:MAG: replication restart helicase PriA [Psychroflexus sp.]|uniref:replication restart helicase PriA n=1 Tax=Psychroflexus sp. S27 TaxID=1982757 RepID=UPI0018656914|nr:primosomal protein N' [Psychroflexus sp. S27]